MTINCTSIIHNYISSCTMICIFTNNTTTMQLFTSFLQPPLLPIHVFLVYELSCTALLPIVYIVTQCNHLYIACCLFMYSLYMSCPVTNHLLHSLHIVRIVRVTLLYIYCWQLVLRRCSNLVHLPTQETCVVLFRSQK